MIELVMRFKGTADLYIFTLITAVCVIWAHRVYRSGKNLSLAPVIILNFALFAAWGALSEMNHDDVAFLHFSWLISQGLVPFRDFWEHHSPFLPLLLAPVMNFAPKSAAIYDLARIFSGGVFLINAFLGWRISRLVWEDKARLSVYLLLVSSAGIFGHYFLLRPDILMTFFILSAVFICLKIKNSGIFSYFLVGISFGLAMSFITKQYLLIFLPVTAIWLGEKPGRAGKLTAYVVGFGAGIAPLLYYLIGMGILGDFVSWVFLFNSKNLKIGVHFPLVILAAGLWGVYVLTRRFRESRNMRAGILVCAFILSTISSLTTTSDLDGLYYLGFWYFICAIAASGSGLPQMLNKIQPSWKRSLTAGLIFSALLTPNFTYLRKYRHVDFVKDKKAAGQLLVYAGQDPCVILLPIHPVFSRDATRLYSGWQYDFIALFPEVRKDAMRRPIAENIIASRPAVIQCRYKKRDFILELYQRKLISAAQYKELVAFLTANYTQKDIGKQVYYIRNDRLKVADK
jgi:hypothetical protein